MSSLVGFLSLVFAIGINFYLLLSRYIFKIQNQRFNLFIRLSSLLTLLSFFSLMYAYVISDFSNYNVFDLLFAGELFLALAAACVGLPIAHIRIATVKLQSTQFVQILCEIAADSVVMAEFKFQRLRNYVGEFVHGQIELL